MAQPVHPNLYITWNDACMQLETCPQKKSIELETHHAEELFASCTWDMFTKRMRSQ